jgi:hypothetical protein
MSATSELAVSPPFTQSREFWVLMGYAVALGGVALLPNHAVQESRRLRRRTGQPIRRPLFRKHP